MNLRPYQQEIVSHVGMAMDIDFRAPMVVLPTGGGKTVCFAHITETLSSEGKVVWIVAHRQELISQASGTLKKFHIPHGIIKSGFPLDAKKPVQVASVQTLVRRTATLPPPDVIIIDECHHAVSPTYLKIIAAFPRATVLGFTATPCRLNGAGLGTVFDYMILGPTNKFLTENGFLSPAKYYAPPKKADFSNVPMRGGDYATGELEEVMDEATVTGDAVAHYQRICPGVPMLVFCVSVAHAHHVAEQYRAAGYRAAAVDGKLSDEDRKDRIEGLGTGKYQVITSCDLIGEGLDVPVCGAAQLLRPTASPALHLQQIGRVLRPLPGKTAIILDHVGNTAKHGFASTDFAWSLAGIKNKKSDKAPATRTCDACYSVHTPAKVCPYCGFEYPVKSRALTAQKIVDGQLVEVEQTREERADEVKNARSHGELVAIAKSRGYQKPHFWAMKTLRGRSYVHLLPRI